ncbi:ParB N-terminal domain-containing protein [Paracoccus versutus]|uniref:ParB N-terminal domain-containing protein n=1 Tax=Paracoccus versutus TaxID=34007 RepID=UPI001FB7299B|nr:ParB N-terminal domain-containing protein [Paracoccus versutus]MCJ1902788.1 ParB N-terminal domain-containing protein [Paracoccus versutus]
MVAPHSPAPIQRIPVDRIVVGNPRERNRVAFKELVDSIAKVGLKRPITVSGGANGEAYQLVCGQGCQSAHNLDPLSASKNDPPGALG